jgi:hypothetical protein
MILKANVGNGIWQYFEGEMVRTNLHFKNMGIDVLEIIKDRSINHDVWDFTGRLCSEDESINGIAEIVVLNSGNQSKSVFAYRPCYILNDEGKTIERI